MTSAQVLGFLAYYLATRCFLVALGVLAIYAFVSSPQGLEAPLYWGIGAVAVGLMDEVR